MFGCLACTIASVLSQRALDDLVQNLDNPRLRDYGAIYSQRAKAFERFYPIALQRLHVLETNASKDGGRYATAIEVLTRAADASRTAKMVGLWERSTGEARLDLADWICITADADTALLRRCLQELLEKSDKIGGYGIGVGAKKYIKADPAAGIAMFSPILKDPSQVRLRVPLLVAFGAAGRPDTDRVVTQNMQIGRRNLAPLAHRNPPVGPHANPRIIDGKTYAQFEWNGVGSPYDLWIFRQDGDKWTDPVFTGFTDLWQNEETDSAPRKPTILKEGGNWESSYREWAKDTDGDGYNDVLEHWLGLDPSSPDTDGDQVPDGIDRCPTASSREPKGAAGAIQAGLNLLCLEGKVGEMTTVELPPNVEPFEVDHAQGLVLFKDHGFQKPAYPDAWLGRHYQVEEIQKLPNGDIEFQVFLRFSNMGQFYGITCASRGGAWIVVRCNLGATTIGCG